MIIKNIIYENKANNSINSLSPYIGKMRLDLADYLISKYVPKNGVIYDPFMGSGTVMLQGWSLGLSVVGSDLNYYAYVLTQGKLNPYVSYDKAESKLKKYKSLAEKKAKTISTESIPEWVKEFYHDDTLKEICAWVYYLKKNNEWFLLANLLGILHHQRPGFLSYPASHGAPYLRSKKYPADKFPSMYEYKNVYEKLQKKVKRSYKSVPEFDFDIKRNAIYGDATKIHLKKYNISTIITSPPYMKALTYARDNRLRLWFLGEDNWKQLDKRISPEKNTFIEMMGKCFNKWARIQSSGDKCIMVIGDITVNYNHAKRSLSEILIELSKKYYTLVEAFSDPIPETKKVVKGNSRIKKEIILVFERNDKNVK